MSPEAGKAIVEGDLFYWHRQILTELVRYSPNTAANAGWDCANRVTSDAEKWLGQLEAVGMVTREDADGETLWDLTDLGREWAG